MFRLLIVKMSLVGITQISIEIGVRREIRQVVGGVSKSGMTLAMSSPRGGRVPKSKPTPTSSSLVRSSATKRRRTVTRIFVWRLYTLLRRRHRKQSRRRFRHSTFTTTAAGNQLHHYSRPPQPATPQNKTKRKKYKSIENHLYLVWPANPESLGNSLF